MTGQELAWAAGLFEGEGTIRINRATTRNFGTLICSVVSTDLEVVAFFADRWPGYMKPATGLGPRQRPAWVWVVAARRAAAFIRDIQPYIQTTRVRTKAEVGLEFQAHKVAGRRSETYAEEDWTYYAWMRELNVRGVDDPQADSWRKPK